MSLRELRKKRGFTSAEKLADKIGMPGGRLREYEAGVRPIENMTLGTAIKICDALRISNPRRILEDSTESPKENKPTSE